MYYPGLMAYLGDIIQKGADMLGIQLDELIQETILAMRAVHEEIKL